MGACRACGYLARVPRDPGMARDYQLVTKAMREDFALGEIRIEGKESRAVLGCLLERPECAPDGGCPESVKWVPGLTPAEHYLVKHGVKGESGSPGAQGERGPEGSQGPQGDRGPAGAPGERGACGERGEMGIQGLQGPRGERGFAGLPGRDGRDGRPGINGRDLRWDAASIGIVLAGEVGLLWLAKLLGWL